MRTVLAAVGLLATVATAHAVPSACWTVAPAPGALPTDATFTAGAECDPSAFVLTGHDNLGGVYLEMSAVSLAYVGSPGPESVVVWAAHQYLRHLDYTGPVSLIDPDPFTVQWLLGSDLPPGWAQAQHAAGMWRFPGEDWPTPLEHSPEPATLLLLGTTLALIGWRVRRRTR